VYNIQMGLGPVLMVFKASWGRWGSWQRGVIHWGVAYRMSWNTFKVIAMTSIGYYLTLAPMINGESAAERVFRSLELSQFQLNGVVFAYTSMIYTVSVAYIMIMSIVTALKGADRANYPYHQMLTVAIPLSNSQLVALELRELQIPEKFNISS
jgi:hypothetical protein